MDFFRNIFDYFGKLMFYGIFYGKMLLKKNFSKYQEIIKYDLVNSNVVKSILGFWILKLYVSLWLEYVKKQQEDLIRFRRLEEFRFVVFYN